MYRYEELDYNQIMNHSEIDPNSGDAYYALAQCCRLGKGIAPSMDMYREYLSYAAEEGHEEAARELEADGGAEATRPAGGVEVAETISVAGNVAAAGNAKMSQKAEQEVRDYAALSVSELRRMADAGNAEAAFRLYTVSQTVGDNKKAIEFLKRAGECATQNGVERKAGQKIFWTLGELYKQGPTKNLKESIQAFEMAAELGSSQACTYLSECYRNGNGGVAGKDPEQAERYRRMAARNGSVGDRYQLAVSYMKENENLSAMELLEQVMDEVSPEDDFYLLSRIQLSRMNGKLYPREELVERLWEKADQTTNQKLAKEAKAELRTLYPGGPARMELSETLHGALTPRRAYLMGTWRRSSQPENAKKWFAWASARCPEAKAALVQLNEEEEQRQKQKAIEEERKKAEAAALAEKKKKEAAERAEREKKEAAERAEREKKAAAEKAERERLAAIEAENRRLELEEKQRQERIEAEARAIVLKEERAEARRRRKEQAEQKAREEEQQREQDRILRAQQKEKRERLAQANLQLQEQYCKEEAKLYTGSFIKYVVISAAMALVGMIMALLSLSGGDGIHLICQILGVAGALVWICLAVRMSGCMRALKSCYPGRTNHRTIQNHLSFQRILMWPIGFVWILNGAIAENVGWFGFIAGAIGVLLQAMLICWIVNLLWGEFFLNDVFDWIRCKNEIVKRNGEVLDIIR